jgi:hypothetical protein
VHHPPVTGWNLGLVEEGEVQDELSVDKAAVDQRRNVEVEDQELAKQVAMKLANDTFPEGRAKGARLLEPVAAALTTDAAPVVDCFKWIVTGLNKGFPESK